MNKIKFYFLCLASAFISLAPNYAHPAKFSYVTQSNGSKGIHLDGEISKGDVAKLKSLIRDDPTSFWRSYTLHLNSQGGSVAEAIKLSELIEETGLITVVDQGNICASSCFMLFISGQARIGVGGVLVHRPFVDPAHVSATSQLRALKLTQSSVGILRNYLEEKSVPSDPLDKMMSLPSTEAYALDQRDLARLGFMNPVIEEMAIKKCGVSNSFVFNSANEQLLGKSIPCVQLVLSSVRRSYLRKVVGMAATDAAIRMATTQYDLEYDER